MSKDAWGDEGNVPSHGRDTAVYQELVELRKKVQEYLHRNRNDFYNEEMRATIRAVIELMDQVAEELNQPF